MLPICLKEAGCTIISDFSTLRECRLFSEKANDVTVKSIDASLPWMRSFLSENDIVKAGPRESGEKEAAGTLCLHSTRKLTLDNTGLCEIQSSDPHTCEHVIV